ncbi:MAG: phosphate-starvation-inducible PsiE family protein [Patescibacteria group bacterium]
MKSLNKNSGTSKFVTILEYSRFFQRLSRFLLSLLIFLILIALCAGIIKTFWDLSYILKESLAVALRKIIVDVLILLAVVEIYKTAFTYFTEGRVRVTYIVDTVLVVMLSELISIWFRSENTEKIAALIGVLFALVIIRVIAIRFHPESKTN